MVTSSFGKNVIIKGKKNVEKFANALEKAEQIATKNDEDIESERYFNAITQNVNEDEINKINKLYKKLIKGIKDLFYEK